MTTPLKQRVLEAARGLPVQKRERRRWIPYPVLAGGAMAAALWIAGGPAHAEGRPLEASAWIVGGILLLAVAATALALPPARSMLPRPREHLLAVMIGVPVLAGFCIALGHPAYADPFFRTGFRCFALTAVTAPWPFVALLAVRRRFDPIQPALSGGALGAAAGAWSAVMVELWCPLASASHVAIGHVAPLAFLVLAGALAGRRLLALPAIGKGIS